MSGFFLCVDGIDLSGKSTSINYMKNYLENHSVNPVLTAEPGGTKIGDNLRSILLNTNVNICVETEVLLMFAARVQHLKEVILPALAANKFVITDRFTASTYAYQGAGKNFNFDKIKILENWVQNGVQPDFNIIFDIPIKLFLERKESKITYDRFENLDTNFFKKVREFYLDLANTNKDKYIIIDGSENIDVVEKKIDDVLYTILERKYNLS